MSDLWCRMSFFRLTPCCSKHPRTPFYAVGIWEEPFEQRAHPVDLTSSQLKCEIRFFCKSCPETWPWPLAILKACGPMKCTDPLNRYLLASIYGSGCNRAIIPCHARGWRMGFLHLLLCRPPANCGGSEPEEVVWACRSAPMDCQGPGVREVVRAQHCPWNYINCFVRGGWVAVLHTCERHLPLHDAGYGSCYSHSKRWECNVQHTANHQRDAHSILQATSDDDEKHTILYTTSLCHHIWYHVA
jgi:hypothetical protein